jgi:hypothetical protein
MVVVIEELLQEIDVDYRGEEPSDVDLMLEVALQGWTPDSGDSFCGHLEALLLEDTLVGGNIFHAAIALLDAVARTRNEGYTGFEDFERRAAVPGDEIRREIGRAKLSARLAERRLEGRELPDALRFFQP